MPIRLSSVLALISLGLKQAEAHDAVRQNLDKLGPDVSVEALVRACLKKAN